MEKKQFLTDELETDQKKTDQKKIREEGKEMISETENEGRTALAQDSGKKDAKEMDEESSLRRNLEEKLDLQEEKKEPAVTKEDKKFSGLQWTSHALKVRWG